MPSLVMTTRCGPAVGLDDPDQALVAEAVHHLGEGAALDLERLGQRQHREVGALRGGAEDHELGVAEPGHGMISVSESTSALLRPRAPAAEPRGAGAEIGAATRRARLP